MTHSSWGPGWPDCQTSKINRNFYVDTVFGRVTFPGGVRKEINELVSRLVKETARRGYRFGVPGNPSYGCWGYNCRAIRGSDRPSNHSWGLAVDINAPTNPMGSTLITDMPGWMPDLWNAYGFRWGGDYISRPDAMHYEFMGSVSDAARFTETARKNHLGEIRTLIPPPTVTGDPMATFFFRADGKETRLYDSGVIVDLPPSGSVRDEFVSALDAAHIHATGKKIFRRDVSPATWVVINNSGQSKQDDAPGFVAQVETGEKFFVTNERDSKISEKANPDEFSAVVWVLVSRGFDMSPQRMNSAQLEDIPELSA